MRLIDADALYEELRYMPYDNILEGTIDHNRPLRAIMNAPTVEVPGWISVKERMPDLDEQVLIVYEWTGRSGAKYREIALDSFKAMRFLGYTPLFWMPLPEPPEEVQE